MKRIILIFFALLLVVFAVSADTSTADVARIHVIANSDSDEDIEIKMQVASAVAELLKNESFDTLEGIEKGLSSRLDEITEKSLEILEENGADYSATAEIGTRYFDKKTLGNSVFPEGDYLALVITLGEGRGRNWWSVIFPEVSLEASLAMGEEGNVGKTVILGDDTIVKFRCLIFDLCNFILTKK